MRIDHKTALTGAFLMEGMRDSGDFDDLLAVWDNGCIELVDSLTEYAPLIDKLAEAVEPVLEDFPGVYHYEITAPFGTWFAGVVRTTGDLPRQIDAVAKLMTMATEFFTRGEEDDSQKSLIIEALDSGLKGWMKSC